MRRSSVLRAFFAVWAIISVIAWPVAPAHATCTNLGGIVTCTADDPVGFFSAADLDSLTVNNGVTVSDTIGGNGALTGLGIAVIELFDFGLAETDITGAFVNNGTISDTGVANFGILVEGVIGGGFINNGTIVAGVNAVTVGGTISGGFVNNGTITGTNFGVAVSDINGGFNNSGTIAGGTNGVSTLDIFGGFNNSGTINGTLFGAILENVQGGFTNTGTVSGTNANGVDTFDILGGFNNSGSIAGGNNGVVTQDVSGGFNNSGTINGMFFGALLEDIQGGFTNTGTVSGTNANGVDTFDIRDGFNNSGVISGGNNGVDTLDIFGGFNNSGDITGIGNDGVNTTAIDGGFTNTGNISAEDDAIDTGNISGGFHNSGMLLGITGEGANINGAVSGGFFNGGTIRSSGSDAIDISGPVTGGFTNAGNITGNDDAIDADNISGGFNNSGMLLGITGAGANISGSVSGGFNNSGTVRSGGSDAVTIDGPVTGGFGNTGNLVGGGPAGDGISIGGSLTGDVDNSGTITGTDDGFDVDGALIGNFTNSGLISATGRGTNRNGVDFTSVTGRFLNTGEISGTNVGVAVEAGTIAGGFINRGRIVGDNDGNGTGDGIEIVSAAGQSATFFNEPGATLIGAIGFHSEAGNETLTNGGTITGTGGTSIDLGAGDDTLNLLPSSILIGLIDMGSGANTLDVARGLNLAATFTGAIPGTINTNGAELIINGNQVVVFDASGFSGAGLLFGDLTTSIFNAIDDNAGDGSDGPQSAIALGFGEAPNIPAGSTTRVWAAGIGGYSEISANSGTVGRSHGFGGAIAGIEKRMSDGAFGFFGGGVQSRLTTDTNAQDTDVTSVLGGVYYKRASGDRWLNMILSGGWSGHNFRRRIANNLAPTGIEFADSNLNGFFLAPALTIGTPIANTAATASLRVNYAGLFLGSFSETGARSSLSFSGRDIHIAGARAQVAVPVISHVQNGTATQLQARIGADGQFSIASDEVRAAIGAGSVRFSPGKIDRINGFFGADLSHKTIDGRIEFRASFEALATFDGDYRINGQLKAIHRF